MGLHDDEPAFELEDNGWVQVGTVQEAQLVEVDGGTYIRVKHGSEWYFVQHPVRPTPDAFQLVGRKTRRKGKRVRRGKQKTVEL